MNSEEVTHDFNEKNKAGVELENFIIKDIQTKKYSSTHKYKPNNGDYDVFIDEINEGIEIKNDIEAKKTKNVCIEYKQDDRLSGISITKAKYWIQFDQTYLYLAYTDVIKKLIRSFIIFHRDLDKLTQKLAESDDSSQECQMRLDKFYLKCEEEYGEMFEDIKPTHVIRDLPDKRLKQTGYYKYMGLFLVEKSLFKKYSLAVQLKNEMTYEELK